MRAFDEEIRQALTERVRDVQPSEKMLANIRKEAEQRRKERKTMKFGMKKIIAAAAAICALSVTCYAAAQLGGVEAHSRNDITKFADLEKAEKKLGMDAKYVESFQNGFSFVRGGAGESQGLDEEGNPMGKTYPMLSIAYQNADGKSVVLSAENGSAYADSGQEVAEGYTEQTYLFVPSDYTLTAEEQAKKDSGEWVVSYGSAEAELQQMENYSWQADGVYYSLTAADCGLGEAAMAEMAAEIMAE